MKAKLEQLSHHDYQQSFLCYEVNVQRYDFFWHYHPEYELTYIVKGKGKRLVGDSYENFTEGDFVLLGPLLPHTWISDKKRKENCSTIVIQFSKEFIESLLQYPELSNINKLLIKAEQGLSFISRGRNEAVNLIRRMIFLKGVDRFTSFIQLLQQLSVNKAKPLASSHFQVLKGDQNQRRINKVFQYVQKEFTREISLKKAASLIHLSESAFCKFFKRASGKTFSDYVNNIRIANACQLIIETDKPISQLAYESGFESLTYFNRIFLRKKGVNPISFRKTTI